MFNFWQNRRVLVTGANGFLASWMVRDLHKKGAKIFSLIFAKNPVSIFEQENFDDETETIYGDLRNFEFLKNILEKYKIETIFHLGAQAICACALKNPLNCLDVNVRGTYNLLEAMRQVCPNCQIIVASSDKAYGIHDILPYEEHFSLKGEFPYEVSKTCTDLISQMYAKTYKLNISIVRCGNLYGGGDGHFSRLIPSTIRRLYRNEPPVLIEDSVRDFLYVSDAVSGYFLIAEQMFKKNLAGEAFNLGNELPRKISEVISLIQKIMNKKNINLHKSDISIQGIPKQYLSSNKAKKLLDWEPKINFEDGLKETIEWYFNYFDRVGTDKAGLSNLEDYNLS